jgi:hypothetical protein
VTPTSAPRPHATETQRREWGFLSLWRDTRRWIEARSSGVTRALRVDEVEEGYARQIFNALDADGSGAVSPLAPLTPRMRTKILTPAESPAPNPLRGRLRVLLSRILR